MKSRQLWVHLLHIFRLESSRRNLAERPALISNPGSSFHSGLSCYYLGRAKNYEDQTLTFFVIVVHNYNKEFHLCLWHTVQYNTSRLIRLIAFVVTLAPGVSEDDISGGTIHSFCFHFVEQGIKLHNKQ